MTKESRLSDLELFCLAVELGSFTRAAQAVGVTPQTASRSIARLEKELGVMLFRRNTRRISPTPEGQRYYSVCRSALSLLGGVEDELRSKHDALSGTVRISVPTTYGHHRFLPMLKTFHAQCPDVQVEVQISNRNVDFVHEGFDLVVRAGDQLDASLVARKLGDFSLGVFASPEYIDRCGKPNVVGDLHDHTCIVFVMPKSGRLLPWKFSPDDHTFTPKAAIQVRDDVLGLVTCACAGVGVTQMYHYLVDSALKRGELVELLQEFGHRTRSFSLVYPRAVTQRPEVRALIACIMEESRMDRVRG